MIKKDVENKKTHIIKLEYEDDILQGLERELKAAGIENGIIMNGIGSATSSHIHVVKSTALPPGNEYFQKEDIALDVVNMQGYIMEDRVHCHISFADAEDGSQFGGHLEPGCRVLTFCIITVVETETLPSLDDFELPDK